MIYSKTNQLMIKAICATFTKSAAAGGLKKERRKIWKLKIQCVLIQTGPCRP
jgi:hypothetical protein